ncbi:protein zyg-11 homolog B [Octopus bimaculoides]|nr:protein zyg-11 homolog B [Octopus bimaculoides]
MYDTPNSLQDCCVDFICDNIGNLCQVQPGVEKSNRKLVFKDPDVCFHGKLSEQILQSLCEKGKLNDETLSLFDPSVSILKRVSIRDAQLTTKGLRILKSHKISELEITGLKSVAVNDVIGCLGEWTLSNLRMLNVSNSTFISSNKYCVVISLAKLQNLQSLNVSNTEFNKHGLEIIVEELPTLESLDISGTPINDISPLRKCKDRLRCLSMYNLRASHNDELVSILCELSKLTHLDVSDSDAQTFVNTQTRFRIQELLVRKTCLPNLTSLDISGKEEISEVILLEFLQHHPKLKFLGLSLTVACQFSVIASSKCLHGTPIVITGEANEMQILESLRRYILREKYIQKSLYTLFSLTQNLEKPRQDIIKHVLPGMKCHPKQLGVQMAATACLYNLTKGEVSQKIHPTCLRKVVELTLLSMENFPKHQQLQKNALLTLCSDRILQDVSFDRFRCAELVMDCLCSFDDSSMNRMSVAICSILAAKISTEETSRLGGTHHYMQKMLELVHQKMEHMAIDITLKFTLSALWNLTDESPATCNVFLNEGGLDLFMRALEVIKPVQHDVKVQVETKILGLLNNIAEVEKLRYALMREDFILLVRRLLQAEQIDVSYFAAGIFAHLASDASEYWMSSSLTRDDVLNELKDVVLKWEQPQGEMVAYRCFKPFFPLLQCYEAPPVQLWACWAIQHVCTKNGDRYCPMLHREKGFDILFELVCNKNTEPEVYRLAENVLLLMKPHIQNCSSQYS